MNARRLISIAVIILCWFLSYTQLALSQEAVHELSLDEVSRLALGNNFDIQLAKYDAQIERTKDGVARSIYDTVIESEVKYRNNQLAQTSTLFGTKVVDNDYNVGLSKKLPSGTTISIDMQNNRSWTNSSFATSNPSHDSSLTATVQQDLGKNFLGIQDRGDVKITKIDIENSEYSSLEKIEDVMAETQKAYWDLVLAIEKRNIAEDVADQAQKLYSLHKEKLTDGLVEYPELYASQANYENRLNELKFSENEAKTKENVVRLLLNITDDSSDIVPKDKLSISKVEELLDESLKKAFESRWDYKRKLNDIRSNDISLSMKKNSIWPQINLTASMKRNGLGDHFKQAVEDITDQNNPEIFAGITFSIPLENTKARSELSASKLKKAKALINLKLSERKITIDIIDQVRTCNVYRELAMGDKKVVELQTKKLQEEEKRFNRGRSNTDTIIRFQNDLLSAKLQSALSKFKYHTSSIELRKKEGTLLDKYWDDEI